MRRHCGANEAILAFVRGRACHFHHSASLQHVYLYGLLAMRQQHRHCVLPPQSGSEGHGGPLGSLLILTEYYHTSWGNILSLPAQGVTLYCLQGSGLYACGTSHQALQQEQSKALQFKHKDAVKYVKRLPERAES